MQNQTLTNQVNTMNETSSSIPPMYTRSVEFNHSEPPPYYPQAPLTISIYHVHRPESLDYPNEHRKLVLRLIIDGNANWSTLFPIIQHQLSKNLIQFEFSLDQVDAWFYDRFIWVRDDDVEGKKTRKYQNVANAKGEIQIGLVDKSSTIIPPTIAEVENRRIEVNPTTPALFNSESWSALGRKLKKNLKFIPNKNCSDRSSSSSQSQSRPRGEYYIPLNEMVGNNSNSDSDGMRTETVNNSGMIVYKNRGRRISRV